MESLSSSSSSAPQSNFVDQLAQIYRDHKRAEFDINQKISLYVDKNRENLFVYHTKNELDSDHISIDKRTLKKILKEFAQPSHHPKILHAAAKALMYLPWSNVNVKDYKLIKPASNKLIESAEGVLTRSDRFQLSPERASELEGMLDNLEFLDRSREGGNGVFFVKCQIFEDIKFYSKGLTIVKFIKKEEARQVILADRFLHEFGFTTPSSKCLDKDSALGSKFIKAIKINIDSIERGHHHQIEDQINNPGLILVMNRLKGVTFRQIPKNDLLEILNTDDFLMKLGELILIDCFIGNIDRLILFCNLGNMLINQGRLGLIDHKFTLNYQIDKGTELSNFNLIQNKLEGLIQSEGAFPIIEGFQQALIHDRKDRGGVELPESILTNMNRVVPLGIDSGIIKLLQIFSNPVQLHRLFQFPTFLEEMECSCKLKDLLLNYGLKKGLI